MPEWTSDIEYENLKLLRCGAAARIVLDRPDALNAWDAGLGNDLIDAINKVEHDATVKAVEIRGGGRAFSSGADLKAGFDHTDEHRAPDLSRLLPERDSPVILGIRRMPKP